MHVSLPRSDLVAACVLVKIANYTVRTLVLVLQGMGPLMRVHCGTLWQYCWPARDVQSRPMQQHLCNISDHWSVSLCWQHKLTPVWTLYTKGGCATQETRDSLVQGLCTCGLQHVHAPANHMCLLTTCCPVPLWPQRYAAGNR